MVEPRPTLTKAEHRIATALGMQESAERMRDKAERQRDALKVALAAAVARAEVAEARLSEIRLERADS